MNSVTPSCPHKSAGVPDGRDSGYKPLRASLSFLMKKRQVVIAGEWVTYHPC